MAERVFSCPATLLILFQINYLSAFDRFSKSIILLNTNFSHPSSMRRTRAHSRRSNFISSKFIDWHIRPHDARCLPISQQRKLCMYTDARTPNLFAYKIDNPDFHLLCLCDRHIFHLARLWTTLRFHLVKKKKRRRRTTIHHQRL